MHNTLRSAFSKIPAAFSGLLAGTLLLSSAACAPDQPSYSGNTYTNPAIGLTVAKPEAWIFVSQEQSLQNRQNTQLHDKDLEREIQRTENLPTVSIAKHPEPHPTVNPTVQIKHVMKPFPDLGSRQVIEAALQQVHDAYSDFQIVEPIRTASLSGHSAATMEATFTMHTVADGAFAVYSEMWVVDRGEDLFIIGMSGPREGEDASREEFAAILSSIRLD